MMLNLSGIVQSMATETATVNRYARQTFDSHGRVYPRALLTSLPVSLSVQPVSGKERQLMPEGIRTSEAVSVWSGTTIKINDQLDIPNRGVFEVVHIDSWESAGAYCKVIARKLDASEVIS